MTKGTLPLALPVVYLQAREGLDGPWGAPGAYRPIQSLAVGAAIPFHVAVIVPPSGTEFGLVTNVAGGKPIPVTDLEASFPPVKLTFPVKAPADVGLNRTVIV